MTIEVRWGSATHVGSVRTANQDAVLAGPDMFVVADGMGGHAAGEVASAITVARMAAVPSGADGEAVLQAVRDANAEVISQAAPGSGREGMGTTVSGVAVASRDGHDALLVFNVGDSRTYLLDGKTMGQVTEDHSLVAEMVRAGEIDAQDASSHRSRNVITRAIGLEPDVVVDHWWIDAVPGQILLTCSDGLSNEVAFADLEAVLRSAASPQQAVDALVDRALDAGAKDNVSAIAVFIDAVTTESPPAEDDTNPRAALRPAVAAALVQAPREEEAPLIESVPGAAPPIEVALGASPPALVTGVPSPEHDEGTGT